MLACLLCSGQPHAFTSQRAEHPPRVEIFPQAFIHAVPAVGLMSEVRESGPYLRAAVTAWPKDAGPLLRF
jgi:hypothetical protein